MWAHSLCAGMLPGLHGSRTEGPARCVGKEEDTSFEVCSCTVGLMLAQAAHAKEAAFGRPFAPLCVCLLRCPLRVPAARARLDTGRSRGAAGLVAGVDQCLQHPGSTAHHSTARQHADRSCQVGKRCARLLFRLGCRCRRSAAPTSCSGNSPTSRVCLQQLLPVLLPG